MPMASRVLSLAAGLCCVLAVACRPASEERTTQVVEVRPAAVQVFPGGQVTFTATVDGAAATVTWSIQEGAAGGGISSAGVYSAPSSPGTYHVVASTAAASSSRATATVTVGDLASQLAVLSGKAIWFGHQSVGQDIMDGVQSLLAGNPGAEPSIVPTSSAASMGAGKWAESVLGDNYDPVGKVNAFKAAIQGGVGARVDIAFFKFCWVDFDTGSAWFQGGGTAAGLFAHYQSALATLRTTYPAVRFVHVTAPLYVETERNKQREEFNALVRSTYGGVEPVFDLALLQSTDPDGARVVGTHGPALHGGYTTDGGHLNAIGQEKMARALVALLAGLP